MHNEISRVKSLLDEALRLPSEERSNYLEQACAGDARLRACLEDLLRLTGTADQGAAYDKETIQQETEVRLIEGEGSVIGHYKLLQPIGEGGFGLVYMAEQTEPVIRRVALKIIKLGMDTKQVVARFEAERQALALMDHPNIAKVLDAGSTDSGRPYFVMELVRGVPITSYCDDQKLTTEERLKLFTEVCHAVQHAHQKGIIHRDLKPSNVLVTLHDGVPVPKIIDFGIAKATQGRLTDKTLFTRYEQFLGTPAYMSPEQAEMSGLDVDTRSDIYSLGVLLYELLTGRTPLDTGELLKAGHEQLRRRIREEEPVKPSTRLHTLKADEQTTVASRRQTEVGRLGRLLRGDLDWIVMKCLEKDRTRRYETAGALRSDVRRHLDHEPVSAVAPSRLYQLRKSIRRHRAAYAAAFVVAVILVTAAALSLSLMIRANRAAEAERKTAAALRQETERAVKAERAARSAEHTARQAQSRSEANFRDAQLNLYAADMIAAHRYLLDGNLGAAHALLRAYAEQPDRADLRGWEWRYLWQRAQGEQVARLRGHSGAVTSVKYSHDGQFLASGSEDRTVIVRDRRGRDLATLIVPTPVNALSFSHDSRYLAAGHEQGVEVWETKSFTTAQGIGRRSGEAAFVVFSPSSPVLGIGYGSGSVELWDYARQAARWVGKPLESYPAEQQRPRGSYKGCGLDISGDGNWLVKQAAGAGLHEVWDLGSLQLKASLANPRGAYQDRWSDAAFVPNSKLVFLTQPGEGGLFWDFESGRTMRPAEGIARHRIVQAAFMPSKGLMATAGLDHAVRLWEVDGSSLRLRSVLVGHRAEVWSVAFAPSGDELASSGLDNDLFLWGHDSRPDHLTISRPMQQCLPVFSRNGRRVALAGGTWLAWTTEFYDLDQGRFMEESLKGAPLAFGPGDDEWVTGSADAAAGTMALARYRVAEANPIWQATMKMPAPPNAFPSICPQRHLLALGFRDGSLFVGDYQDAQSATHLKLYEGGIHAVALSPNGKLIFTDGYQQLNQPAAVVWSCEDLGNLRKAYVLSEQTTAVDHAIFSADGSLLATGGVDARIRLWDALTGKLFREMVGSKQTVYCLCFSPDRQTLAAASHDGSIKLWHVATGRELVTFQSERSATAVVFSPDGNTLVATSGPNPFEPDQLHVWRVLSWDGIETMRP